MENPKSHADKMSCPHCQAPLTIKQVITLLNGSGYRQVVAVKLPDGTITHQEAGRVNPNAVEILE